MQFEVDRDDHALGGPDGEHQLDDLWPIFARDRDASTGRPERGRQPKRTLAQFAPCMQLTLTVKHGATIAVTAGGLVEQ
jgi:hypothetical protein